MWTEEIPFHWVARSDSFFLHLEGAPVVHCYWGPCTHLGKSSRPVSGTFLSPWGALNSVCQPFNFHFAHARRGVREHGRGAGAALFGTKALEDWLFVKTMHGETMAHVYRFLRFRVPPLGRSTDRVPYMTWYIHKSSVYVRQRYKTILHPNSNLAEFSYLIQKDKEIILQFV